MRSCAVVLLALAACREAPAPAPAPAAKGPCRLEPFDAPADLPEIDDAVVLRIETIPDPTPEMRARAATMREHALHREVYEKEVQIELERAYALGERSVLLELGTGYRYGVDYTRSRAALRLHLRSDPPADRRQAADKELALVERQVAWLSIRCVEPAQISLDDLPLLRCPARVRVPINPGRRALKLSPVGATSCEKVFDVTAGARVGYEAR